MGEDVATIGLFTLRDYNSHNKDLKPKDHLFCITYMQGGEEYQLELIWKRGKKIFMRTCNPPGLKLPQNLDTVMQWTRLKSAVCDILDGKDVNLLEI